MPKGVITLESKCAFAHRKKSKVNSNQTHVTEGLPEIYQPL